MKMYRITLDQSHLLVSSDIFGTFYIHGDNIQIDKLYNPDLDCEFYMIYIYYCDKAVFFSSSASIYRVVDTDTNEVLFEK